jgi:hypothetical protein
MTLKQWQTNGWLKIEPTSRDEIANMLAMVDRDLKDAAVPFLRTGGLELRITPR